MNMSRKIWFLVLGILAITGLKAQRKDCDALLSKEMVYRDRIEFWHEFLKLKGCGIDSIDVNVFGKASYLNFIYNKFESNPNKIYFRDLIREVQAIRKTHDYLNVRSIEVKDATFLKKIARLENWDEDKKYLARRGFKDHELNQIYKIIEREKEEYTYEDVILNFQEKSSN